MTVKDNEIVGFSRSNRCCRGPTHWIWPRLWTPGRQTAPEDAWTSSPLSLRTLGKTEKRILNGRSSIGVGCERDSFLTGGRGHLNAGQQEEKSSFVKLRYQDLHRAGDFSFSSSSYRCCYVLLAKHCLRRSKKKKKAIQHTQGAWGGKLKKIAVEMLEKS